MKKVKKMKKVNKQAGFTLIEMLIVLFVIGALLLIAIPNLTGAGVDAQEKACEANKKLIITQAESYYLENRNRYPESLEVLEEGGYLRDKPICPSIAASLTDLDGEDFDPYVLAVDEDSDVHVLCPIHDVNSYPDE